MKMPVEENRARLADVRTDKGIVHHDVSTGTQMGPSIRGDAPISREPTIPNGLLNTLGMTPDLRSDLPKLGSEKSGRVRDAVGRK
jgi:hypothetical protein